MRGRRKERGIFLTVWLVLMLIANVLSVIGYLIGGHPLSISPYWVIDILAGLSAFNILLTIFLFMWKKWAFFAFCGVAGIAFGINLALGLGLFSFAGLAGPVILYLAMRGKWNLFE